MKQEKKNAYDFVGCFHALIAQKKIYADIEKDIVKKIKELLSQFITLTDGELDVLYVGHDCGIPHTATDFSDVDDNGVAKMKIFEYIRLTDDGELEVEFEDGTKSTNFVIDDTSYLVDDILDEIKYLSEDYLTDE